MCVEAERKRGRQGVKSGEREEESVESEGERGRESVESERERENIAKVEAVGERGGESRSSRGERERGEKRGEKDARERQTVIKGR